MVTRQSSRPNGILLQQPARRHTKGRHLRDCRWPLGNALGSQSRVHCRENHVEIPRFSRLGPGRSGRRKIAFCAPSRLLKRILEVTTTQKRSRLDRFNRKSIQLSAESGLHFARLCRFVRFRLFQQPARLEHRFFPSQAGLSQVRSSLLPKSRHSVPKAKDARARHGLPSPQILYCPLLRRDELGTKH